MGTSRRFDAAGFLAGLFDQVTDGGVVVADPKPPGEPEPALTPDDLPAEWREHYQERAAIREYDGGQAREHAEAEALRETLAAMRAAESQAPRGTI